jgi:membrane fusion protein (multidrug efflux system)
LTAIEKSRAIAWLAVVSSCAVVACGETKKPPPPPPPTVYVATVARRNVPLFIEAVGSLDGYVNAEIRARVRGFLQTQDYPDGAIVKAGRMLFTIESTDYAAAVSSARAALTRAQVAQSRNAIQADRYKGLFKTGMVSQQDLDNVVASVADADGQVQAARAQLQQAELNLSYTQLRSPIDGVAGLALVRVGNLVGQDGPTLLTTVSRIDPIRVNFPVSEVDYVKNPERFKQLALHDLAWAKSQFLRLEAGRPGDPGDPGIDLVLSDGTAYGHKGVIVATDRQIDPSTGTLQLQALIPNPDGLLRPGQYGKVRIRRQDAGQDVLAVPERALISVQGMYSIGVVGPDNKVQLRRVDVGPSVQGLRLIQKGIAEGDRIVVDGVQKISDGAVVDPRPAPDAVGSAAASGQTALSPASGKN